MMRIEVRPMLAAVALALCSVAAAAQATSKAMGHWEGAVKYGNPPLAVSVDLSKNAAGAWIGSFAATGTTTAGVPLTNIVVDDLNVKFTLSLPDSPSFEGKLSPEGDSFSGTATNSQGSAPFELKRSGDAHVEVPPASTALPKEFEGQWEGAVEAGGSRLRLGMRLATGADGKAKASLISIDQGAQEFQATTVTVDGKKITVEVRSITGVFTGTLGDNGELAGEWSQGPQHFPLTFKKAEAKKP